MRLDEEEEQGTKDQQGGTHEDSSRPPPPPPSPTPHPATTQPGMDQNSSSQAGGLAFTLVADESESLATSQDLRAALEKGTDELKLETLRRIVISTLNGNPHVSLQRDGRGTSTQGDD